MAKVHGYYINLDQSKKRRERIENHLKEIECYEQYERFTGIKGNNEEALKRGLKAGELGLWRTWLNLLEHILNKDQEYEYIHILEDDAVLSSSLMADIKELNPSKYNIDILVTEMYVNTEIWKEAFPVIQNLKRNNKVDMTMTYTGCLSSTIVSKASLAKVYKLLRTRFNSMENLIPIDNELIRYASHAKLKIACTIPFLSYVENESISQSEIRAFEEKDTKVLLTQELNSLLRKSLSKLSNRDTGIQIIEHLAKMAQRDKHDLINKIILYAINQAEDNNMLSYKYDKRLRSERRNPQRNSQ